MSIERIGSPAQYVSPPDFVNPTGLDHTLVLSLIQTKARVMADDLAEHIRIDDISNHAAYLIHLTMTARCLVRDGKTPFFGLTQHSDVAQLFEYVVNKVNGRGVLVCHAPMSLDLIKSQYHHFAIPDIFGSSKDIDAHFSEPVYVYLHLLMGSGSNSLGVVYGNGGGATFLFRSEEDAVVGKCTLMEWTKARRRYKEVSDRTAILQIDNHNMFIPVDF